MSSRVLLFACVAIATQQYGGAHNSRNALTTTDDHWMMTDHNATSSDQPMRGADHQTKEALPSYASDTHVTISEHLGHYNNKNIMMRSTVAGQPMGPPRRTRTQNSPLITLLHHLNKRQVFPPSNRLYTGGLAIKPTPSPVQTKFFKEQIKQLPSDIQEQLKGIYAKVGFTDGFQELLMRELSRVKAGNSVVHSGQGDISAGDWGHESRDGVRHQHVVGRLGGGSGSLGRGGAGNMGPGRTGNMASSGVGNMGPGRTGNMASSGVGNMESGGVGNMGHERLKSNVDSRTVSLKGQLYENVGPMSTQIQTGMERPVNLDSVLPRKQGSSSAASSQRSGPNANAVNTITHTKSQKQTRPGQSLTLHEKIDVLNQTARHYVMEQFRRTGNNEVFRATVDRLYTDTVDRLYTNVNSRPAGHPINSNTWHRPDPRTMTQDGHRERTMTQDGHRERTMTQDGHRERTMTQDGHRERMVEANADNKPLETNRDGTDSLVPGDPVGQKVRAGSLENIRASVIGGRLPVETRQHTDTGNIHQYLQGTSRKLENRLTSFDNLNTNKLHATRVVERPEYHAEQQRTGQQVQSVQREAKAREIQHHLQQTPKQQEIQQKLHGQQTATQHVKQSEQLGLPSQQRAAVDNIRTSPPMTLSPALSTTPHPPSTTPNPPTTPSTTQQPATTRRHNTTMKPPPASLEFFNTTITIPDHINRDPIMRAAFLRVIQRAKEEEVKKNKMATTVLSHTPPSPVSQHATSRTTTRTTSAAPSSSPTTPPSSSPTTPPSSSSSTRPPTTPSFYNKDVVLTPALFMTWSLPPSQVTSLQGSPLTSILTNISASRNSLGGQSSKVEQFRSFLIQTMMTDPQSVIFIAGDVIPGAYHERSDHGPTILVKDLRGGFVQQQTSDLLSRAKRSTNQINRIDWFKVESKMLDKVSVDGELSHAIRNVEPKEEYKDRGIYNTLEFDTRLNFTPESQAKCKNVLANQNFRLVCNSFSDARERATCVINLRRHHVKRSLLQCKKLTATADKMTCRRNVARKLSFEYAVSFQPMKKLRRKLASPLANHKTSGNDFVFRKVALTPRKREKRQVKDDGFLIPVLRFAWMLPPGTYPTDPLNTMDYIMAKFNTSLHNGPRLEVTHQESKPQDILRARVDRVGPITIGQGQAQAYMNSPVIILDKLIEAANALSKLPGHSVDFLTSTLHHTHGKSGLSGAGENNPLGEIISVLRQQKLAEMTGGIVPPMGIMTTEVPHPNLTSTHTTKTTSTPAVVTTTTTKPPVVSSSISREALVAHYDVNALMLTMQTKFQGIPDTVLRSLVVHLLSQLGPGDNSLSHAVTPVNETEVNVFKTVHMDPSQANNFVECSGTGCKGQVPLTTSPVPPVAHDYNNPQITAMVKTHSTQEQANSLHHQLVTPAPLTHRPTILTLSPTQLHITTTPTYTLHPTIQTHLSTAALHPTPQPRALPTPTRQPLQPAILPTGPHPTPQPPPPPTVTSTYPYIPTFPYTTSSLLSTKYVTMNLHFKGVSPPETTSFPIMPLESPYTSAADRATILSFLRSINSRGVTLAPNQSSLESHSPLSQSQIEQLPPKAVKGEPTLVIDQTKIVIDQPKSVIGQPKPVIDQPKPAIHQPKPVIDQPKPVIDQPKPVIDQPKPVIDQPKPALDQPKPVIDQPKPVIDQPKPVIDQPKPVIDQPKPTIDEPKPVIDQPKPVIDQPKPIIDEPKPVIDQLKPVIDQLKPVIDQPKPVKPVIDQLKPVIDQPKPVKPVIDQPKPVIDQPKPVIDQPKPAIDQLQPVVVLPVMDQPQSVFDHPIPTGHLTERAVNAVTLSTLASAHETIQQPVDIHGRQRKSQMPTILPNVSSDLIQLVGSALTNILSSNPAHNFLQTNNHAHLAKDALQAITSNNNQQIRGQGRAQEQQPNYNGFDQSGHTNLVQSPQGMDSGKGIQLYEGRSTKLIISDLLQQKVINYDAGQSYTSVSSLCPLDRTLMCGPTRPSPRLADFCHQRCDVMTGECTSALCTCSCQDTRPVTSHGPAPTTAGPFLSSLQSHGLQISAVDPDLVSTTPRVTTTTGSAEQRLMRFLSLVDKVKATKGEKTTEEPEADR